MIHQRQKKKNSEHEDATQTQLMLGPSPFSGAFQLLILNHITSPQHLSYPFPHLPCLLPLFDSQENPANVFNVLRCIIYQTGCWYGKRTRGGGVKKMGNGGKKSELKMSKKREYVEKKVFTGVQSCKKTTSTLTLSLEIKKVSSSHMLLIKWSSKCDHFYKTTCLAVLLVWSINTMPQSPLEWGLVLQPREPDTLPSFCRPWTSLCSRELWSQMWAYS